MKQLIGTIQPYAWGSPTAIPELLGVEPSGDPQAELWLGAHPSAPAEVDGEPLDGLIDADADGWVGADAVHRYGRRLPFLMKVLAAARPLSLQAHPNRTQAEEGFAREERAGIPRDAAERTYRDDWPKPEAICALGDFEALCGFREPDRTYALVAALEVPEATELVAPLRCGGAEELRQVFGTVVRMHAAAGLVDRLVREATQLVAEPGEPGRFARTAVELAGYYPGDPGVLAALMMNRVSLRRYQALYLPPGNLHAYLRGTGVEIMANSDNVLRGGLTGKHVDVEELLRLLDFTPARPGPVPVSDESAGVHRYGTGAAEFALWRLEGEHDPAVPADGLGRVLLGTDGSARIRSDGAELSLAAGRSVFLRADETAQLSGRGTVFVGATGND